MSTLQKEITIVGFGNSITEASTAMPDTSKRWLNILEQKLCEANPNIDFNVINSGKGGNSDREKMRRFQKDVLEHTPDYLLIEFGGNNSGIVNPKRYVSLEESAGYLKQIREEISASTKIVVITFPALIDERCKKARPEVMKKYVAQLGQPDANIELYRELTRDYAREHGYPLVDLSLEMRKESNPEQYVLTDGVHLNEAGNRLLADITFKTLNHIISSTSDTDASR